MEADNRRTKDRTFRAQETNAPHGCGLERHFSSLLWLRGRLERHFSGILWLRSRLERHFLSILRLRGRLEQHFSRILRLRATLEQHFSSILRLRARLEPHFSSILRFRGKLSGHFEPAAAPGLARAAISSHLRPGAGFDSCGVSSSQAEQLSPGGRASRRRPPEEI